MTVTRRSASPRWRSTASISFRPVTVSLATTKRCISGRAPPLRCDQVHREEGRVEADERQPEMQLPEPLVVHAAGHLREPVVDPGEDREQRAAEEHIVDVRDDEVRVADVDVDRDGAEVDPGKP